METQTKQTFITKYNQFIKKKFFEKANGTEPKTASNIQINMNGTLSRIFRPPAQYFNTHFLIN